MPTIEIAIYESEILEIDQDEYRMAIMKDDKLISHRGFFFDEFKNQNGVMLHLGNEKFKKYEGIFWGSELIDWDSTDNNDIEIPQVDVNDPADKWGANQQYVFQLNSEFRTEIDKLLKIAINRSKVNKIGFLTDYQFGPEIGKKRIVYTIKEFWEIHDSEKIVFNTIYEMYQE